jgi:hypothetical protein
MSAPDQPAWVADPSVAWNILLSARPVTPVPPERLAARLKALYAVQGWARPPDPVDESDLVTLQQRLVDTPREDLPVVVGRADRTLVVSAHHSRVDGLGLLGVLAALVDVPVRSSVAGLRDRPRPVRSRAVAARLAEVAFAPPARVHPSRPSPTPAVDTIVSRTLPGSFRTADLVHAGMLGVAAYNGRRGGTVRHLTVAVGASWRGGDDLEVADRSALIRLRDLEGVGRDEIAARLRQAGVEQTTPGGRAAGRAATLALRLLGPRLGSTLLLSHLGDVTCDGVEGLAFSPVTGGGSGVSLGAVGHGASTTLTLRSRGRTHDADGLAQLLEAIGEAATSGGG